MLEHYGVDSFPTPIPLNMKVISKRVFVQHEEWRVEYDVETAETMPVGSGRSVTAYLQEGMRLAKVSTGGDPSYAAARRAYEEVGYLVALPGLDCYRKL